MTTFLVFYIGNEKIDIVQSYTFQGSQISSTGNFTLSLEHLGEKAVHATLLSLKSSLVIQSLVMPINLHRNDKISCYTSLINMLNY